MIRIWGVWRCSESCNGSFHSIAVFSWKSQLDCSALPSLCLNFTALSLQIWVWGFFGLFFLLYSLILFCSFLPSSELVFSLQFFSSTLLLCCILLSNSCLPVLSGFHPLHLDIPYSFSVYPVQCYMVLFNSNQRKCLSTWWPTGPWPVLHISCV